MSSESKKELEEEYAERKKVKMVVASILDIFAEQKLTINECREVLKSTELTIEKIVDNAVLHHNN